MNEQAIENFDDFMSSSLEPDDYPGDEALVFVVEKSGDGDEVVTDETVPARENWRIRDDTAAAYGFWRIAKSARRIEDVERLAEQQIEQIREYVERATKADRETVRFFEFKLTEFYVRDVLPTLGPKDTYTYRVLGGVLSSTSGGVSTVITDEAVLRAWLGALVPEMLHAPDPVPPTISKAEVKTRFGGKIDDEPGETPAAVAPDDPAVKSKRKVKPGPGDVVPGVKFVRSERTVKIEPEVAR